MSHLQPRPGLLDIVPYVGGESQVPGVAHPTKLASNESALGPSPRAISAITESLGTLHRYPDGACTLLRTALARRHDLHPNEIICGAGSDELFGLLARAYAGHGDEVLHTVHGFSIYPIVARSVGATPVAAPECHLTADIDALLARVTPRTRLLFLANPNNPTGTYLSLDDLRRLRKALPPHVLMVVDSAYAEYVDAADYGPGHELVQETGAVVVTRTFSKIYGLGGLRLGWGHCPADVVDVLNRLRMPFNVSSLAQVAGLAALQDVEFVTSARDHNRRWRAWTMQQLRNLGLEVPDSQGNFVIVRFPSAPGRDAVAADHHLKSRGLIARRLEVYGLPQYLRITIGREDEMGRLVEAIAEFVTSAP